MEKTVTTGTPTDAGLQLRALTEFTELQAVVTLFGHVWGREENPPFTIELLRAFSKAGNYIGGAFIGDEMVGAAVAFSSTGQSALHSHIAGVSPAARGRNVGFALKLHQREWAIERGFSEIMWTFDPLVSRNAYFNLVKLAAEPVEYLPNFYGGMSDDLNGTDESDRLLVRWDLASSAVVEACAGRSVPASVTDARAGGALELLGVRDDGGPQLGTMALDATLVAVPHDIERMRSSDPARASLWRFALREALTQLMESGATVSGFDRTGWYIFQHDANEVPLKKRTTP